MMSNAGAAALSMRHGLEGPSFAVSTACASGAHALGCGLRMLQSGEADAVVAGGSEAGVTPPAPAALRPPDPPSPPGDSRPLAARPPALPLGAGGGAGVRAR